MTEKEKILFFLILGISIGLIIGSAYTMVEYNKRENKAEDLLEQCQEEYKEFVLGKRYDVIIPFNLSGVNGKN